MDDKQLQRYGRHILMPDIDFAGQERLLTSSVLIVGMGGLGSPVAMYLAAAGVGHLILADDDKVDHSNLQRQIIHDTSSVNELKVESARKRLLEINPDVKLELIRERNENLIHDAIKKVDLVVDGSDNYPTRFRLNELCYQEKTPLISGAVIRWEGQVTVFDARHADSPCYRCLYSVEGEPARESCSETGVVASVPGIIGSIQATEAIKIILGDKTTLVGRVLVLDASTMEWREIRLKKDPSCPVCGG